MSESNAALPSCTPLVRSLLYPAFCAPLATVLDARPRVTTIRPSSGNGRVDRTEFRKALREMGCRAPSAALDAIFASFDTDRNKAIDYNEMHELLVRSYQLHPHLQPLQLSAKNTLSLRKVRLDRSEANLLQGLTISEADLGRACAQIRQRMRTRLLRVIDVFRQFDDDESGLIDLVEFEKACREMGFDGPRSAIEALFHSFDVNGDFTICYDEMHRLLRDSR